MRPEKLSIRPYARLLTMLGEQLIKNEKIALVELIKNSYDADADWVQVRFENFNDDMSANENSSIVIKDNGHGMTYEDIRDSWMNPASPKKYKRKKDKRKRTTPEKKRIIQGEKGIGRFAILKLGKTVTVATKTRNSEFESILEYDFTKFDNDFIEEDGEERDIFLDEIEINYSETASPGLVEEPQGTVIEIRNLKGAWGPNLVNAVHNDVISLTDPVSRIVKDDTPDSFRIDLFCNGKRQVHIVDPAENLKRLIEDKAVLKIQGEFNSEKNAFIYTRDEDGSNKAKVKLSDSQIRGLWIWRQQFVSKQDVREREYECGDFKFHFYIFDFSLGSSGKHQLNREERKTLKDHRIYLYRDGIRVYPYGDRDDDWLRIDVDRGIGKAGDFFSNDQIIGWVDISQEQNPNLRDKTNREGLIEKGTAVSDFIFLIRIFLSYIRQYPYSRYQEKKKAKNVAEIVRSKVVGNHLSDLRAKLADKGYRSEAREIARIGEKYKREKSYLVQRARITEDLAGVGLSVEMASHDIMLMMGRAGDIAKELSRASRDLGDDKIRRKADMLIGILTQITESMSDVQSLFKSTKRRKKTLKIEPILDKMYELYKSLLKKKGIKYKKVSFSDSPLVADTTDGVVMQVLINLFDNASYWLDTVDRREKEIRVTVDGTEGELIFSDNGPGIDEEDLPYVFEPFYSGKGQEGRGLGLYIARQLLNRHDYNISIAGKNQAELPGANFVVSFVKEDS